MSEIKDQAQGILANVEESNALYIQEKFDSYLKTLEEYKTIAFEHIVTDENDKEGMEEAKKSRLLIMKIRTNADKTRQELKKDALAYGSAVQGIYNLIEEQTKPIEEHLRNQELFAERAQQAREEALRIEREKLLEPYLEFMVHGVHYGKISEAEWKLLYNGAIKAMEDDIAQKKAEAERIEAERIAKEKADAEAKAEAERIRAENEKLKAELDAKKQVEAEAIAKAEAEAKLLSEGEDFPKIEWVVRQLELLKSKLPECKSARFQKKITGAGELLNKMVNYLNS
jgi:hypothetical protein